jgi:hypothetical protein
MHATCLVHLILIEFYYPHVFYRAYKTRNS